jgi:hypothetical protein
VMHGGRSCGQHGRANVTYLANGRDCTPKTASIPAWSLSRASSHAARYSQLTVCSRADAKIWSNRRRRVSAF